LGADMTDDGCMIVFSSTRDQLRPGDRDLWMSTRDSVHAEWRTAVRLPATISTVSTNEERPSISGDGLILRFRRGSSNMISTRSSQSEPWSVPIPDPWTTRNFRDYTMTKDGLTQCRPMRRLQEGSEEPLFYLRLSRRSSTEEPFEEVWEDPLPMEAQPIGMGSLSNDGKVFVYAMDMDTAESDKDYRLYYVIRQDWDEPWSTPERLFPDAKKGSAIPCLIQDGKTLIFTSSRPGGQGGSDIWLAQLEKK